MNCNNNNNNFYRFNIRNQIEKLKSKFFSKLDRFEEMPFLKKEEPIGDFFIHQSTQMLKYAPPEYNQKIEIEETITSPALMYAPPPEQNTGENEDITIEETITSPTLMYAPLPAPEEGEDDVFDETITIEPGPVVMYAPLPAPEEGEDGEDDELISNNTQDEVADDLISNNTPDEEVTFDEDPLP